MKEYKRLKKHFVVEMYWVEVDTIACSSSLIIHQTTNLKIPIQNYPDLTHIYTCFKAKSTTKKNKKEENTPFYPLQQGNLYLKIQWKAIVNQIMQNKCSLFSLLIPFSLFILLTQFFLLGIFWFMALSLKYLPSFYKRNSIVN